MIDTLLGKVVGLLEKDFLFASFLPALIFLPALVLTFAIAVGIRAIWAWIESWATLEKGVILAVSAFVVVIFAYVISSLRTSFAHFWSGHSNFPVYLTWPFLRLGESYQRWRFTRLRDSRYESSPWGATLESFEREAVYDKQKRPLPILVRWYLMLEVGLLYKESGPEKVGKRLNLLAGYWLQYSGEDLTDVYQRIKQKLKDWDDVTKMRLQSDIARLDRTFGSYPTIKATKLGNIIASYDQYASSRYKIEAEIFWPRLQKVISPEFFALIREPRILLDFALTMASLSFLYSFLVLIVGPWLWFNYWLWGTLALIGFTVSFFFYKVCISAAIQLGELIRASFDLFRLQLMTALERPHPASFKNEQEQWEEFSQLVVYGDAKDFKILERK